MATTYNEMIFAAIASLDAKDGSNESTIIKHIESTSAETLPEGYTAAISETLAGLKDSGELLFANDLYFKPGSNPPPRRGRGRPKKPKQSPPPPGAAVTSLRPRGRPPKAKDSQANAVMVDGGVRRGRGRPAKKKDSEEVKVAGRSSGRRGRPPKKDGAVAAALGVKRGRGRPRKVKE